MPSSSTVFVLPSTDDLPIARSSRNSHPIYNFLSYHNLSLLYSGFVCTLFFVSIPKTINEAFSHTGWRHAMVEEMTALCSNGTCDLVTIPPSKSPVSCWVCTVKVGPDG